ncbi:hypothetical protein B7494_g8163 [Chlorociboria aeruginascens]|nr:hypothetical protein B7494_g8163 [Chlorociboria aeruginascens]
MSLARAFTQRRNKRPEISAPLPARNFTTKHSPGHVRSLASKDKISSPLELVSTTNMLTYNAPDIYPRSSSSSASGDESDRSPTSASTPLTSPDTSSIESSPTSTEQNHLSSYFGSPVRESASSDEVPMIPKRALSHTKKSHEVLSRKRSMKMAQRNNSTSTARSSIGMFESKIDTMDHPFGNELAQVSELAEEFGISKEKLIMVDEEEQELVSRGFFKFCAEDYISEIQGLFTTAFGESRPKMAALWI